MTYAPNDLLAVARYLNQGAPWESLGIVGDAAHVATGGYHVGRDDLATRRRLGYDYSVVESARDANPTDAASAVDFAGRSWWRPLTLWLVDQAVAGISGTEDLREIIYTPDGFGADFTPTAGVLLRVATKPNGGAWNVQTVTVFAGGDRVALFLPDGTTKIGVGRVKRDSGDVDTDTAGNVVNSAETCPVWWDLEFEKR